MKKLLFLTLLFLVFLPNIVKAYCSDSETIRLQKLAKNVTVSYIYDEETRRFTVTFLNLKKDLVLLNIDNMTRYNVDGDISFKGIYSGKHSYIIYASNTECGTGELTTKYVMLPYLNPYYNSDICEGIENYSYCSKWMSNYISSDIWSKKINAYRKTIDNTKETKKSTPSELAKYVNQLKEIYAKYYFVILPILIIILGIVIARKNKKNSLV